ncbi:hypothetical protein SCG7086_AQ_00020 [Chlamydiales bacterium SCGC AG-110-P3]|nr:hypothetical protein SCG7086_AQ_00020 [Chlamydiales bacterium SCGC AG-110-P3]
MNPLPSPSITAAINLFAETTASSEQKEFTPEIAAHTRILLIDDQNLIRETVRMQLEILGCCPDNIIEAADGLEALTVINDPDLIIDIMLLDIDMPHMNGIELAQELQSRSIFLPAICHSGSNDSQKLTEMKGAGVQNFLPKPFRSKNLKNAIETVIDHTVLELRSNG